MCWFVVPESAPNATNPKGLALQAATRQCRALRGRKQNVDRILPCGKLVASCSLGNRRSKGPLLGIGVVGGATRVDTVQTMACLDIYRLLRQLQTVNTVADSCSCRWSKQFKTVNTVANCEPSCRLSSHFLTVKTSSVSQPFSQSVTKSVSQTVKLYKLQQLVSTTEFF